MEYRCTLYYDMIEGIRFDHYIAQVKITSRNVNLQILYVNALYGMEFRLLEEYAHSPLQTVTCFKRTFFQL